MTMESVGKELWVCFEMPAKVKKGGGYDTGDVSYYL